MVEPGRRTAVWLWGTRCDRVPARGVRRGIKSGAAEELALRYVLRLRSRRPPVRPSAVWRCLEGCLLLAAYDSTIGR